MGNTDSWYQKSWRPAAAIVYLLICLFDFVLMPSFYEAFHQQQSITTQVALAVKFESGAAQIEALKVLHDSGRVWEPLTLKSSGFFHLAFGAFLGIAAWTRGQEKIENIKTGTNKGDAK